MKEYIYTRKAILSERISHILAVDWTVSVRADFERIVNLGRVSPVEFDAFITVFHASINIWSVAEILYHLEYNIGIRLSEAEQG